TRTCCFHRGSPMARNQVQFQKGLSEASFAEIYGTEEQCHAALVKWRWPNGFECPGCNGADHCVVTRGARRLFQCNACRKQTSVKGCDSNRCGVGSVWIDSAGGFGWGAWS